jgi:hypothetical protein
MNKNIFFISECPLDAVSLSGKMSENFHSGQEIILVDRNTRRYCTKFVQRVVDTDDGNCVLDLYY